MCNQCSLVCSSSHCTIALQVFIMHNLNDVQSAASAQAPPPAPAAQAPPSPLRLAAVFRSRPYSIRVFWPDRMHTKIRMGQH